MWTERADLAPRSWRSRADFTPSSPAASAISSAQLELMGRAGPIRCRSSMQAERYVAPRLALVGEAAHVIHPIAGQGLNLGIRDVAALAELIVDARRLGLDIGKPQCSTLPAWRRLDAMLLAAVTDGLNRLFSNSIAPLRLTRDLGLAAVDRSRR